MISTYIARFIVLAFTAISVTVVARDAPTETFSDAKQWRMWLGRLESVASLDGSRTLKVRQVGDGIEAIVPRFDRPERFDVGVTVSWNEASRAGGCSLVLGVSGDAHYIFTLNANGQASVSLITADESQGARYEPLTPPGFFPVAVRDRQDRLTVEVRGQKLAFIVNDRRIAEIVDMEMIDHWVLGVFAREHRDIAFDNLIVATR